MPVVAALIFGAEATDAAMRNARNVLPEGFLPPSGKVAAASAVSRFRTKPPRPATANSNCLGHHATCAYTFSQSVSSTQVEGYVTGSRLVLTEVDVIVPRL